MNFLHSEEERTVDFRGVKLRCRFRGGYGKTLVILFSGAMNRVNFPVPRLQNFLPLSFPQIALADPGMDLHKDLRTSWYLGDGSQDLPMVLTDFLNTVSEELGTSRKIFVGGSAGGFAALLYSYLSGSDSLAIASCPQTDILRFKPTSAVEDFRSMCFGGSSAISDIALQLPLSLPQLYGTGFKNHAIVQVSSGDSHTIKNHVLPLLQAVDEADLSRLLLNIDYWGVLGHSGSVPFSAWGQWLNAACSASDWSANSLMQARRNLGAEPLPGAEPWERADLEMACSLYNFEISRAL